MHNSIFAAVLALAVTSSVVEAQPRLAPDAVGERSLRLRTREYGTWPNAVAALQAERYAQGQVVHVRVLDDLGRPAPCGSYELELDAAGARAFRVMDCDRQDDSTAVQLISRAALFTHTGRFSRPRAVMLAATEVWTGSASGGAALTGGASVACSVRVRPYIDDLEHGSHIDLTPDRYFVRVRAAGVDVASASADWVLQSGRRTDLDIAYDVVDRASGEVVLRDEATLACGSTGGDVDPSQTSRHRIPSADRVAARSAASSEGERSASTSGGAWWNWPVASLFGALGAGLVAGGVYLPTRPHSDLGTLQTGVTLAALGAGVLVGAILLGILGARPSSDVSVAVGPNGGGIRWQGRF